MKAPRNPIFSAGHWCGFAYNECSNRCGSGLPATSLARGPHVVPSTSRFAYRAHESRRERLRIGSKVDNVISDADRRLNPLTVRALRPGKVGMLNEERSLRSPARG